MTKEGPVHTYPNSFETGDFSLVCNYTVIFCPSHLGVLQNSFKRSRAFPIDLETRIVSFSEEWKTVVAREDLLEQGENQQHTQPTYGLDAGI